MPNNNTEKVIHSTSGDGNCFFHALFGTSNNNGIVVDEDADLHRVQLISYTTDYLSKVGKKIKNGTCRIGSEDYHVFEAFITEMPKIRGHNEYNMENFINNKVDTDGMSRYLNHKFIKKNEYIHAGLFGPLATKCFDKNFTIYSDPKSPVDHIINKLKVFGDQVTNLKSRGASDEQVRNTKEYKIIEPFIKIMEQNNMPLTVNNMCQEFKHLLSNDKKIIKNDLFKEVLKGYSGEMYLSEFKSNNRESTPIHYNGSNHFSKMEIRDKSNSMSKYIIPPSRKAYVR